MCPQIQGISADACQKSILLPFIISLAYLFQFYAARNLKYEQNLVFYFNYMKTILFEEEKILSLNRYCMLGYNE